MSDPRTEPISATTRYCAVFGHPIQHSASPAMHNAALKAVGLNWRYLAFDVHPDDLGPALTGARVMKFIGLNLTVPHKLLALDQMDHLAATASEWGAVNTVRFEARQSDDRWVPFHQLVGNEPVREIRSHGFNTDADAITRSLREDLDVSVPGSRILVVGAGGAGRVAALKLAADGAECLYLVNRTVAKAVELAREIECRFPKVRVETGYPAGKIDLLLNATALGLSPTDPLPLDRAQFDLAKADAVYDMIYRPAETLLLKEARAAGCRTANGIGMLLYQGAAAFEIWTDRPAPLAAMRVALNANIYGT